ncbi:MAG TPA: TolC family outer membrane protein [Rhizomicrobium sp.]|nr:TolC family outer membrane protein [Rhizomicrobium sp.]
MDALAFAYETNPQLAQARAALAALDQGVAQANAGWRPSLNATTSYGYDRATVTGFSTPLETHPVVGQVTLSQPVYRGGQTYAEISRAEQLDRAGQAQLVSTEQSVFLSATTAYADVVRDLALLDVAHDNARALDAEARDVHTEFSAGEVTRTDVQQADARLARARANEAVSESQLAASRAEYEDVIGRPAETLEKEVGLPSLPGSKDAALQIALKENPDLNAARASERAADFAIADAVGAMLPQISILGQYQYLHDAANESVFGIPAEQRVASVVAQLNVPIYQGGGEEAAVRRAKDTHEQAELAISTAERGVRQNLDSAWETFHALEVAVAADRAQSAASQSAVAGMKEQQRGGERSVINVLDAQQDFFFAETSLEQSLHDQALAAFRLLAATGQLTAEHLQLRVTLYDPQVHYNDNANAWFGLGK